MQAADLFATQRDDVIDHVLLTGRLSHGDGDLVNLPDFRLLLS